MRTKKTTSNFAVPFCWNKNLFVLQIVLWPGRDRQRNTASRVELTSQLTVASSPGGKQDYYNRKGFPSIQLQLVVDDNLYIISALRAILAVLMMAAYLRTVHFVESWTLDSCRWSRMDLLLATVLIHLNQDWLLLSATEAI